MDKPKTIGELCKLVTETGECKDAQIYHSGKRDLFTCISGCKKLDGFIKKYWGDEDETD